MNKHFDKPKAYSLDGVVMVMRPVVGIYYKDNDNDNFIEFCVQGIGSFRQFEDGKCYPLDGKNEHFKEFPYRIFDSEADAWAFEIESLYAKKDKLHKEIDAIVCLIYRAVQNLAQVKESQNETKPPQ